ncbi:MAG: hypothetical protein N3A38_12255, partial [Planctomycetota bacterium]|nr:hypothetical protein [Planctomycetota bacterium]
QIKLVKPSEFHFKVFEEAKRIDMEARVAWESQYAAWERAAEWLAKGTGNESDPVWQDMKDRQELAIRAVKAMETYLKDLIRQYEQNDMRAEFMAARVGAIADMVRRVSTKEHPAIASGLERTRPRTEADAQPDRMKQLRAEAIRGFADNQKLATLCLERILKQVFDWRDLQTTLIRTTMLHEEQEETLTATTELGPKTLGWKIEDLADDVQDKLLTLGKRQNTIYDVETELEKELEFQMFRAEKQKRKGILVPLLTAYRGLREKRVNDNLKLAASSIQANQLLPIVKNQKEALEALALVKGGLLYAGQKVDPEDTEKTITLAMVPSKIVEVEPKPAPAAKPGEEAAAEDTSPVASLPQEVLKASMGLGGDPLTAAITGAWEAQDQVRSRTKYLSENSSPEEMPRFVRCKQGILLEKQADALEAIGRAIQEASKGGADFVREMLEATRRQFEQSRGLISERQISAGTQRLQNDSMETLDDLRRLAIPVEKAVKDVAEENRSRGGIDAFNRQYLVRDKDLDRTTDLASGLNRAHILQREVLRHLNRFANLQGATGSLSEAEKANRARAAEAQKKALAILQDAASKGQAVSEEVAPRVKAAGIEPVSALKLAPVADAIAAGKGDRELVPAVQEAVGVLEQAIAGIRNLLEERVRPQVAAKAEEGTAPKMTLEEWERMRSPAYLREKLKDDDRIPAEVREIILRTLSKEFPARHREMLAAYFASLLAEQKGGKAAGGGKEEEKK